MEIPSGLIYYSAPRQVTKMDRPEIRTYSGVEARLIEHLVKCRRTLCLLCDLIWLHPKRYVGRTTKPS